MHDKAILDGHKVVPVDDLLEWGRWFEKADRIVAQKSSLTESTSRLSFLVWTTGWVR